MYYSLESKLVRGWGGAGYTSPTETLTDVVTATWRKHLLISKAAPFQTLRAHKHQQALSRDCSYLNPHVKPHYLASEAPTPQPLTGPLCSAASPGMPVNTIFQGEFCPLAGCTAHISFSPPCKHTHPANSILPNFSDFSFQLFCLVGFNLIHPSLSFPRPREGDFLSTSPVAPFWGKSCPLCQKWLCPIFKFVGSC